MEEKWWSKFQNRTSENTNNVEEKKADVIDNTTLDDAINFIQDLSEKIENKVDTTSTSEPLDVFGFNVANSNEEVVNSDEVQNATIKAHEIMDEVKKEVSLWGEEACENDNPIIKDFDNVKQAVVDTLTKKEVQDVYNNVKTNVEDLSNKFIDTWHSPEVQNKYEFMKEKVEEQLDKEPIRDSIEFVKDKAEDAKKWAFEVYNRENVQEGVNKIKETSIDVVDSAKDGFQKIINNPGVQSGYTNAKQGTINAGKTIRNGVINTFEDVRDSEGLNKEFSEWRSDAWKFAKQSGRVIAMTAVEIKNNENVQKAVAGTGKVLRDTANKVAESVVKWAHKRRGVEFLEYSEEENKED